MRFLVRAFVLLLVVAVLGGGIGWYLAGREAGPAVAMTSPGGFVGQASSLAFTVESPGRRLTRLDVRLEQNDQAIPIMSLADVDAAEPGQPDRLVISRPIGKKTQPGLVNGPARIVIVAARPVFFGLRTAETTVSHDVQVRLDPPRVAVLSIHHYINLGGAEFVVLRATPDDVAAGVRVGDAEYPAFPGSSVGIPNPAVRVAFFALRYDQDVNVTISAFARDAAGNQASTPIEHRPFPKTFVRSRIAIDQGFLDRVVPAIVAETDGLDVDTASPEGRLKGFLVINGSLREKNAEAIKALAAQTRPEMLWRESFAQLGNTQVESRFADQRTYFYGNDEIDRQVHLGFDLASVQHAPVHAANTGVVVFADYLGIYGNCVILDHGLGVQSLYAHLSSIDVKPGDRVEKGAELGRTGVTGLAGGDHLHFTMLVDGTPVNPVEWWDSHWMEDRVFRKIREAGGSR
ncbi:MAG TPA: M23 family metallopeptidase [Vicinamibacterales bacterium]|nr:M23 family metallopeptidase [Vicinamibacterales bacterium]